MGVCEVGRLEEIRCLCIGMGILEEGKEQGEVTEYMLVHCSVCPFTTPHHHIEERGTLGIGQMVD